MELFTKEQKARLTIYAQFKDDAEKAYNFIMTGNRNIAPANHGTEETVNTDARPDGVYLLYGDGSFELFTGSNPTEDIEYIGVKMGDHSVAVALRDCGSMDSDGNPQEFRLINKSAKPEENHPRYTRGRINAYEDFDGKGNTEHIKTLGTPIPINPGEWIPSLGEIGIIMMNLTKVNEALDYAGGDRLKGWRWSSTEFSQNYAWGVSFSDGYTNFVSKYGAYAVRAVAAF